MDILHRIRSRSNSIKSRHDKEEEDECDIEHEQTEHETEDINTEREHTEIHNTHNESTVTEHLKNMNTQIHSHTHMNSMRVGQFFTFNMYM